MVGGGGGVGAGVQRLLGTLIGAPGLFLYYCFTWLSELCNSSWLLSMHFSLPTACSERLLGCVLEMYLFTVWELIIFHRNQISF